MNTPALSIIVHHIVLHLHCKYRKLILASSCCFPGYMPLGCVLVISAETAGRQMGSGTVLRILKSQAHRKMLLRTGKAEQPRPAG